MEKDLLNRFESQCIQDEAPYCQAACPIHVDARALCGSWAEKNVKAARLILERTMPLPGLTAHMCEAPCMEACLRKGFGGALSLGELERAAIKQVPRQSKFLPVPPKDKSVAVLGDGAAALASAWDLAKKGWQVELFQSPGAPLTGLNRYARTCPQEHLDKELKDLASLGVKLRELPSPGDDRLEQLLDSHEAVLFDCLELDPDKWGFAPLEADELTLQLGEQGLFAAGRSRLFGDARFIDDLCEGRRAATSADRLLRGASLTAQRNGEGPQPTRLKTNTSSLKDQEPLVPSDPKGGYSQEEASKRPCAACCQCLECVRHCVYLQEYKGYPKAYARQAYNNEAIVKGSRDANPLINSCSLCGQCSEICPHDFSMSELCLGARRRMVDTGHMPPSAHYFGLKEMDSAWEPWAFLARHAPGRDTSAWLFFPGCQLSGLRPDQVRAVYDHLRGSLDGGVGLLLACCGAPARWAGRQNDFEAVLARIRQTWQDLDCPRIITGCTSCLAMFKGNLPEIDAASLWEIWQEQGAPTAAPPSGKAVPLAMEDPCTTRNEPGIQRAARDLARRAGRELHELEAGGRLTECCGYGGLMADANPGLADKVIQARAEQSPDDYLTYCAMCRERLAQAGKRTLHLLDLYFPPAAGDDPAGRPPLGLSQRWDNRSKLRQEVVQALWPGQETKDRPWSGVRLDIPPGVEAIMDERRILADDLRQVIYQNGPDGSGFIDQETGRTLICGQLGPVTYWVEYTLNDGTHQVHRAWSHRMQVERART
jgi:Fe-S oxidoreductase